MITLQLQNLTAKKAYDYVTIRRKIGEKSNGKPDYHVFYGKTKREAEAKNKEAQKKLMLEECEITRNGGLPAMVFIDWAKEWLSTYKYGTVKDITYQTTYEHPTRLHIIPQFGDLLLTNTNPQLKSFQLRQCHYLSIAVSLVPNVLRAIENIECFLKGTSFPT